ncbi:MAG: hypothetical protein ACTJLL_00275 [Anaplasma sp.]
MLHFLFFNNSESNGTNNATEPNIHWDSSQNVKAALWMSGICLALVAYIYIFRCICERNPRRSHAEVPRTTLLGVQSPFNEYDVLHSRSFTNRISECPRVP